MNFPSQIFFNNINHGYRAAILNKNPFWLLPYYMAVATYCYYEKVCRSMHTAIVSYLLKILELNFSSKLDWGSYMTSIAKTASKKIGALIGSVKFLSPEVALYLYQSTIQPCMEYCCHVWAGASSYKNRYVWQLVLHFLPLCNPWLIA